ncbi:MAG: hypothetical protein M1830_000817 [Pleopsidium flavum]|nr:MAG: hypothetical protein M1830_000817 [Pleopsidium flavum]
MAALHSALQTLSPTAFSSVPLERQKLQAYLQDTLSKSQVVIESVPPPTIEESTATRTRSNTTTSIASNASEISASSARSAPPSPEYAALQKEWGKPIKLAAKDNPLGMAVYKLSSKDGKGAWFARRSVHEGLGFSRWKKGLEREFPESLEVQGGPGEGNIRGIGGEKRVESINVDGVGKVEVYHLSAQFPGPTTPRDFVTLLLTSSTALKDTSSSPSSRASSPVREDDPHNCNFTHKPRHFMVISKPCIHPNCPPREGFIRGEYESVEFIREIPIKPKKSSSAIDLSKSGKVRPTSSAINKEAVLRNAQQKSHTFPLQHDGIDQKLNEPDDVEVTSTAAEEEKASEGRRRGKTISFAESRGRTAKGEQLDVHQGEDDDEAETSPVEWIMITRSDPGGSVPRWMVERGTPSGIVADAGKFLDWACKKEHPLSEDEDEVDGVSNNHLHNEGMSLRDYETNGHLAGVNGTADDTNTPKEVQTSDLASDTTTTPAQGGMMQSLASAAYAGLETYAPKAVVDHLPGHPAQTESSSLQKDREPLPNGDKDEDAASSIPDTSSIASFASADSHFGDQEGESKSVSSKTTSSHHKNNGLSIQERELAKLNERKKKLDEKLAKSREKELKDREELTSKEETAIKKAEEKHAKEVARQEEKYKKEVARLEAKKSKEAAKLVEKKKKAEDKDEKARLVREKEEIKAEMDLVKKERDILRGQVGELQKENTALAARLGKVGNGKDLLKEVREEILGGGKGMRSRSSSLESGSPSKSGSARSREATILGKEKPNSIVG